MIKTKKITTIKIKLPNDTEDLKFINVLSWHDITNKNGSKYHFFSPFFLRTDGQEDNLNPGNVLFENFWQGSKVWPRVYDNEVWAHAQLKYNNKYLWWSFKTLLGYEDHLINDQIQNEYFKWRDNIFNCKHPIRYPNGFKNKSNVSFSLLIDKNNGLEKRFNYIEARKNIYLKEYCRLIKKLDLYKELVDLYKNKKKTLIICETDVPDNEIITRAKLEKLIEDPSKPFGHGLCLAWCLLDEE